MLGFKSVASAWEILGGIEMVYVMRKEQTKFARGPRLSIAEQFSILAG